MKVQKILSSVLLLSVLSVGMAACKKTAGVSEKSSNSSQVSSSGGSNPTPTSTPVATATPVPTSTPAPTATPPANMFTVNIAKGTASNLLPVDILATSVTPVVSLPITHGSHYEIYYNSQITTAVAQALDTARGSGYYASVIAPAVASTNTVPQSGVLAENIRLNFTNYFNQTSFVVASLYFIFKPAYNSSVIVLGNTAYIGNSKIPAYNQNYSSHDLKDAQSLKLFKTSNSTVLRGLGGRFNTENGFAVNRNVYYIQFVAGMGEYTSVNYNPSRFEVYTTTALPGAGASPVPSYTLSDIAVRAPSVTSITYSGTTISSPVIVLYTDNNNPRVAKQIYAFELVAGNPWQLYFSVNSAYGSYSTTFPTSCATYIGLFGGGYTCTAPSNGSSGGGGVDVGGGGGSTSGGAVGP